MWILSIRYNARKKIRSKLILRINIRSLQLERNRDASQNQFNNHLWNWFMHRSITWLQSKKVRTPERFLLSPKLIQNLLHSSLKIQLISFNSLYLKLMHHLLSLLNKARIIFPSLFDKATIDFLHIPFDSYPPLYLKSLSFCIMF